jgi:hypothetical protein
MFCVVFLLAVSSSFFFAVSSLPYFHYSISLFPLHLFPFSTQHYILLSIPSLSFYFWIPFCRRALPTFNSLIFVPDSIPAKGA